MINKGFNKKILNSIALGGIALFYLPLQHIICRD